MGYLVREVDGEKDIAGETAEITRERERERDPSPNSNIFWDIFGPSIGPHTTRPLQPHGDEKNPTTISCTSVGMSIHAP